MISYGFQIYLKEKRKEQNEQKNSKDTHLYLNRGPSGNCKGPNRYNQCAI